jgi:hypothetical protein
LAFYAEGKNPGFSRRDKSILVLEAIF